VPSKKIQEGTITESKLFLENSCTYTWEDLKRNKPQGGERYWGEYSGKDMTSRVRRSGKMIIIYKEEKEDLGKLLGKNLKKLSGRSSSLTRKKSPRGRKGGKAFGPLLSSSKATKAMIKGGTLRPRKMPKKIEEKDS